MLFVGAQNCFAECFDYESQQRLSVNKVQGPQNGQTHTAQKMKFSIKDFFSKWDQIRRFWFPAGLVTFTEEILHGKLHFL